MFQFFKKKPDLEKTGLELTAMTDGRCIPLEEVNDPVFSGKALGDGIAIVPEDCVIAAPCDGTVSMLAETLHAFGMTRDDGLELMVHIGIDTVALKGEGFEALVESGQTVKKGDPMLKLDLDFLKEHAPSVTSPVLCTELEDNQRIRLLKEGPVKAGEALFEVEILQ